MRVRIKSVLVVGAIGLSVVSPPPALTVADTEGSTRVEVGSVSPARLLDTRPAGESVDGQYVAQGAVSRGEGVRVKVAGRGGVPVGAAGAEVNIAAISPAAVGFATAFPCSATPPNASVLNYTPGVTIANATTVRLSSAGELCLYSSERAHFAIDVLGQVVPSAASNLGDVSAPSDPMAQRPLRPYRTNPTLGTVAGNTPTRAAVATRH